MSIYDEIKAERKSQDAQWGGPAHDDEHSAGDFFGFIEKQIAKGQSGDARAALVKIAALAVAAIEAEDRHMLACSTHDG